MSSTQPFGNTTTFRLIGTDTEDNALFCCSYCGSVIPLESDGSDDIETWRMDDTCPECGATILTIDVN